MIFIDNLFLHITSWKLEQPVKEAEKIVQKELSSEINVLKVENYMDMPPEELNERLDAQLKRKRYILNKFWITPETIDKVNQEYSIQHLYK